MDRNDRLTGWHSGPSASSSQDYMRLASLLYEQSADCAKSLDGNCSVYALAGIPALFSAFRALLVEGKGILKKCGEWIADLAKPFVIAILVPVIGGLWRSTWRSHLAGTEYIIYWR